MSDIIVTTPQSQMANAAQEAKDCMAAGGGTYFRRFPRAYAPHRCNKGDRVWYVEDGYIRGFCVITEIVCSTGMTCDTTGRQWPEGIYIIMDATRWHWIKPVPMRGFQGFRYVRYDRNAFPDFGSGPTGIEFMGEWRDPKPAVLARERR